MKKIILSIVCMATALTMVGCGAEAGDASNISVITREEGSGTRSAFVEITEIMKDDIDNTTLDAIVHDGTGKVMTAVANDKNAIGYISLGSLNDTVKGISIDGIAPTNENVTNKSYSIARPFNIAIKEEKSPLVEDFINFIISDEAQQIANDNGFVSIYENNEFRSTLESGEIVIGGSTSVYPLMEKIAEAYKVINPNATVTIEAIGSSAGIKGAIDGTFDIGMASRNLKESEKSAITHMEIALDGIAVIANKESTLDSLTLAQVKGIYTGTLTSFSDIQG